MNYHGVLVLALVALAGCRPTATVDVSPAPKRVETPVTVEAPAAETPAPVEAPAVETPAVEAPDKVVVRVADREIRDSDIERRFQAMIQSFGQATLSDKQIAYYRVTTRLRLVDMLVRAHLVDLECKRLGIAVTDADRQARLQSRVQQTMRANNWSEKEYEESILKSGAASVAARHDQMMADPGFTESIQADKLLDQAHPDWRTIDPEAVRNYYQQNKTGEFLTNETVRASHILIGTQDLDEAGIELARQKGMEILEQAQAPGADFAELARRYSQCPSASQGGDVGYFVRSRKQPGEQVMLPAFTEVAFALEPGQISHLVKTGVGYHVIKVTDRQPARQQEFDEVKDRIESKLVQELRKKLLDEQVKRLQEQVAVVWLEETSAPRP